ncbi:MAG: phenylacetate--CoA ligase family protein [Planctomycetota bacterium]|jgi:phenylacetate-CoA ligase
MNQKLAKYLFFYPVRFLRGEPIYRAILNVKEFENINNVKAAQWWKLQKLLENAYDFIPYYKNICDLYNVNPKSIKDTKDFTKLPFLTKDVIREKKMDLKNPRIKRYDSRSTSGSTGDPLKFIKDRYATAYYDAVMYSAYSWHGVEIGDKQIRFWGMPKDLKGNRTAILKDFFMNRVRLSAFSISNETYLSFIKKINKTRPHYFYGYPSMIYLFARFLMKENIALRGIELKAIICTGEQLFDKQREIMQECFQTKVINEYGSTEVGVIGLECTLGNMHEMSSNVYLEIVKDGFPVKDEEGEICVTELNSKTSPFIRYKIGDKGILFSEKCKCGLHYPIFKVLSGRIDDFIITPEGKRVYDAILAYTLKNGVVSFNAVQKNIKSLDIYIVADSLYNEKLEIEYCRELKRTISPNMDFVFHCVDEIKREKSGKLRYFRSEIQ